MFVCIFFYLASFLTHNSSQKVSISVHHLPFYKMLKYSIKPQEIANFEPFLTYEMAISYGSV